MGDARAGPPPQAPAPAPAQQRHTAHLPPGFSRLDLEALDKLGFRHLFGQSPVEPVQPNVAFDIASLVLYGCQALPIRLKILLDRLFSVLQREEVLQVLHGFGWTHEDYARGYILQEPHGGVLDRWNICSPEEEPLVLQQFLRFGETRAITQQLLLAQQELGGAGAAGAAAVAAAAAAAAASSASASSLQQLRIDSDIKKFIERTAGRGPAGQPGPPPPPHPHPAAGKPPGPPPPPRDRDTDALRHKQASRASPPSSHHPPPLNLGLQQPPPPVPASHAPLPPTRPPPPPPMSPLQKNVPLNFLKLGQVSNGPCTASSPPSSISSSPLSVSPLNRLQSMQPFDFRKMGPGFPGGLVPGGGGPGSGGRGPSPDLQHARRRISEASDTSPPGLMNLSLTSPTSLCLPPPLPPPPASTASAPFNHHPHPALMTGPLSASLVASSLPGLISSVGPGGAKSPSALAGSGGGSSEFGSEDEDDDEENSHSALNLSRDGLVLHGKPGRPPRHPHLRKASTPVKRQWGSGADLPLNLGTQLINPTTGKKRVQCNVCLKTFCDKGALKIHFSAVHLREMHKCTVEGCNMMFSSRRSRNRHSANPNPKLHSPHLRRKISPHDGRTAQSHPLLIPPPAGLSLSAALNPLSFSPFPLLTPPPELRAQAPGPQPGLPPGLEAAAKQSLDLSMHRYDELRRAAAAAAAAADGANSNTTTSSEDTAGPMGLNNHHTDDDNDDPYDDDEEGIVVDGGADDDDHDVQEERGMGSEARDKDDDSATMVKRVKLSESDADEEMTSNLDSNEDSLSVVDAHSLKEENGVESAAFACSKQSVRKRKNQNPTRCAVPVMMGPNDMSDEDSSDEVVFPAPASAGGPLPVASEDAAQDLTSSETDPKNEQGEVAGATIKQEAEEEAAADGEEQGQGQQQGKELEVKMEQGEEEDIAKPSPGSKECPEQPMEQDDPEEEEMEMRPEATEEADEAAEEQGRIETSLAPLIPADKVKRERPSAPVEREDLDGAGTDPGEDKPPSVGPGSGGPPPRAPSSAGSHHSDESLDSSHALRQLESLSHGHFGDLLLARGGQAPSPLVGQHPFPGLGYMVSGGPPSPARSQGSSGTSNGPDSPSEESQGMFFHESTGFIGNMDVPIDKDNPRRCTACGKIFQNHFGVKTHFQNVHLKLMHKCTVEGCNAAFPSKRSRDRHSANLNLHRKLLSTSSSDKAGAGLFMDKSPFASLAANPSLHGDFLARLYAESQSLPLNLDAFKNLPPPHLPPPPGSLAEQMMLNGDRLPPPHPSLLLPPLGGLPGFPGLNSFPGHLSPAALAAGVNGTSPLAGGKERGADSDSPKSPPGSPAAAGPQRSPARSAAGSPALSYALDEEPPPAADPDSGLLPCAFCSHALADGPALKDHYEREHRGQLLRCAVPGCAKAFCSRERRAAHSDNEALHAGAGRPASS